ncbi:pentatricopeptide repeat-containing protein At1g53600, mitochondrial [Impatiens glandulifera]|uniref:pentatricopeptide repeat-containing protein At1g53600, mitochondrial n=1 Tax=Impatiens glandulifera TaxID=253017 RepID=UPI001FB0DEA4|nr:pentatricopeptide repeat-containing protein At1g53600, mitochondrial [Impatiens glandulifera]
MLLRSSSNRKGLYRKALNEFSTSTFQILKKPDNKNIKFIIHCNTQISKNGRIGNIKEAEDIFSQMPNKTVVSWTAMLTSYAENGRIKEARRMFDEMPERNIASWNAMITAYGRTVNRIDEANLLFMQMPERNAVSYAAMISGFARAGMLSNAIQLYYKTPANWKDPVCANALISGYLKVGDLERAVQIFEAMSIKDVVSWSSIVDGYCKHGRLDEARKHFDVMPERNIVTWTSMIDGYLKMDCFEQGFGLFLEMRNEHSKIKTNPTTITMLIEACGNNNRFKEGQQVHSLALRMGLHFDVFLGNSLITMYCKFTSLDSAANIFSSISQKDVVSWNCMISGYVQAQKIQDAYNLFQRMPKKDVVSWTTMITGFFSKGMTQKSVELFDMMPKKDDIAWTAIISGFVSNLMYKEAIFEFVKMLGSSVKPNPLTLSSVISASSCLAAINVGTQFHAYVAKTNMESDLSVANSLISMYSKCGNVETASIIFHRIISPNVVSYNSLITGYTQNGFGKEAIKVVQRMLEEGQQPNDVTFLEILSGCAHSGLLEEGWYYFRVMRDSYGIEPGADHYACMVDLLGRGGLVDDAMNLIESMPVEPHGGVWGALLGASRTHMRPDVAKIAADRLFELESGNGTPYLVLSEIYSCVGKQLDGEKMRITCRTKGMNKNPGCSWIITEG